MWNDSLIQAQCILLHLIVPLLWLTFVE